jgi:general secretion pathway protein J
MQVLVWQNNAWRQAVTTSTAAPPPGAPPAATDPRGLQVALQLQGREVPMLKSFLLGEL